jgi:hypothetical protein
MTYFGRPVTAADREDVRVRLAALGFPFGDHVAQVDWCRRSVGSGAIMRDAITEKLMAGRTVSQIAETCGLSPLRVYHYLSRGPDMESVAGDPWRLVHADQEESVAA